MFYTSVIGFIGIVFASIAPLSSPPEDAGFAGYAKHSSGEEWRLLENLVGPSDSVLARCHLQLESYGFTSVATFMHDLSVPEGEYTVQVLVTFRHNEQGGRLGLGIYSLHSEQGGIDVGFSPQFLSSSLEWQTGVFTSTSTVSSEDINKELFGALVNAGISKDADSYLEIDSVLIRVY